MFGGGGGDKGLSMPLGQLTRLAWADPDVRQRLLWIAGLFGVYTLGIHVPVPIPGVGAEDLMKKLLENNAFFDLLNTFGGGAIRRLSIFALGLNPYITASIILQVFTQTNPAWKKEMQEGGEHARRQQNKRTRFLTFLLCLLQGYGLIRGIVGAVPQLSDWHVQAAVLIFWTAGAMFILWLGEQISEKGIGNGVSLMIFAGIIISLPYQTQRIWDGVVNGIVPFWSIGVLIAIFVLCTWFVVFFTSSQRRIPVQHMRRNVGIRQEGGRTSYLPLNMNLVGVIPIIFAISLMFIPAQVLGWLAPVMSQDAPAVRIVQTIAEYLNPIGKTPRWIVADGVYTLLIFVFTYFYTAIQYPVEDIADNLKRMGSFIPGVRPGKQTRDFLDGVVSRITFVGAVFLAIVALVQYVAPALVGGAQRVSIIGGTTLLIVVSVALDTLRQVEANLLMKQYGS